MGLDLVVTAVNPTTEVSQEAILGQLARMLRSSIFVHSRRLGRFLRFTIETTLAGRSETLKEYLIGIEVYDRKPPYHPSTDSIVRSEARRLRIKLKQYYESVGRDDSILIYYHPGGYTPVFQMQHNNPRRIDTSRALGSFLVEGLVAQGLSLSAGFRELDVQIVFEGTVRISQPGSASISVEDCLGQEQQKWITPNESR